MFHSRIAQLAAIVVAFVGVIHSDALAEATGSEELSIRYNIRETPGDPSSAVIWTIDLALQEEQVDGNDVGWLIDSVTISQLNATGQAANVWTEATPTVNSPDGLWWLEHADPQDPHRSEFAKPPVLESTATAQDPANADLNYYLKGVPYNPPPEGPPFVNTGALAYTFTLVGSSGTRDVRTIARRLCQSPGPKKARAMKADRSVTAAARSWLRATCPFWRASDRRRG